MDKVRSLVSSGAVDADLANAILTCGKKTFEMHAARNFARSTAAKGDLQAAEGLAGLLRDRSRKSWSAGGGVLTIARSLFCSKELVEIAFEGGDKVLLSGSIASGHDTSRSLLSSMVSSGLLAEAVVHSRIVGDSDPEVVFAAMADACMNARSRKYVSLLSAICEAVGPDRKSRLLLLDAAVAHAGGWLPVSPLNSQEKDKAMRLLALNYVPPSSTGTAKMRRRRAKTGVDKEYKTVTLNGFSEYCSERVEVLKC